MWVVFGLSQQSCGSHRKSNLAKYPISPTSLLRLKLSWGCDNNLVIRTVIEILGKKGQGLHLSLMYKISIIPNTVFNSFYSSSLHCCCFHSHKNDNTFFYSQECCHWKIYEFHKIIARLTIYHVTRIVAIKNI